MIILQPIQFIVEFTQLQRIRVDIPNGLVSLKIDKQITCTPRRVDRVLPIPMFIRHGHKSTNKLRDGKRCIKLVQLEFGELASNSHE